MERRKVLSEASGAVRERQETHRRKLSDGGDGGGGRGGPRGGWRRGGVRPHIDQGLLGKEMVEVTKATDDQQVAAKNAPKIPT